MSQSNDPPPCPAPCADKGGGHGEATDSLCDGLRSGVRQQRKGNLATVTMAKIVVNHCRSSGEEEEGQVMGGVVSDAAFLTTHREILRVVYGVGFQSWEDIVAVWCLVPMERFSENVKTGVVECIPDRNQTAGLTWNRKPDCTANRSSAETSMLNRDKMRKP